MTNTDSQDKTPNQVTAKITASIDPGGTMGLDEVIFDGNCTPREAAELAGMIRGAAEAMHDQIIASMVSAGVHGGVLEHAAREARDEMRRRCADNQQSLIRELNPPPPNPEDR